MSARSRLPPHSKNQPSLGGRFPACEAREHAYIGAARPSWRQIVDTSAFAGELSSRLAVRSGISPGQELACFSATSTIPSQTQAYRRLTSQGPRKLTPGPEDFAVQLDRALALGCGFRRKFTPAHRRYGTGERIESFLVVDLGKCHR